MNLDDYIPNFTAQHRQLIFTGMERPPSPRSPAPRRRLPRRRRDLCATGLHNASARRYRHSFATAQTPPPHTPTPPPTPMHHRVQNPSISLDMITTGNIYCDGTGTDIGGPLRTP